jgi:hypothetical protein
MRIPALWLAAIAVATGATIRIVSAGGVPAADPTLRPGQYELVSEIALLGRADKAPPRKELHCYTPDELRTLANIIVRKQATQDCKVLSSNVVGSTMKVTTECAIGDGNSLTSSAEVQFTSAESFHAVVTMKQIGGRAANPIMGGSTITITAKRIGDCAK